jgi:hypothetical protein
MKLVQLLSGYRLLAHLPTRSDCAARPSLDKQHRLQAPFARIRSLLCWTDSSMEEKYHARSSVVGGRGNHRRHLHRGLAADAVDVSRYAAVCSIFPAQSGV